MNILKLNRINLLWTHTSLLNRPKTSERTWMYCKTWDPPHKLVKIQQWILRSTCLNAVDSRSICYPMIGSVYIQVCVTVQTRILQQSKSEYIKFMKGIMHKYFASLLRNTKIIGMIKWYLVMKFYCNFCEHF